MRWQAQIVAEPKHFKSLVSATVIFDADDYEMAEEQADAYASRLGIYDSAVVDALFEVTP